MGQIIFFLVSTGLWLVAVISDASADRLTWLLVDLLAWPVGVLRGIFLLFGGS